jgi:hypothetical protein
VAYKICAMPEDAMRSYFFLKKKMGWASIEDEVLTCLQVITNERGYVPNTSVSSRV